VIEVCKTKLFRRGQKLVRDTVLELCVKYAQSHLMKHKVTSANNETSTDSKVLNVALPTLPTVWYIVYKHITLAAVHTVC
jgi:hypothetical protein